MNLQRIKQLAGIKLNEGVMAVPGIGQDGEIDEKSTSEKQARFMAAAAHNPEFAKEAGMDRSVAKEFNNADTGTKQLSNAMKTNETLASEEDILMQQYRDGDISRDEFMDQMDRIAYTDNSMRQGEMGLRGGDTQSGHDAWSLDQSDDGLNGDEYEYSDQEEFDEAYDLNNGYDDINCADGSDYFPNGADGPVVKSVGPSGARQGDNPEQKKMQVAEVHKELVYGYRNYLKETKK